MTLATDASRAAEISRWIDHSAITELINRYAKLFDERNFTEALPTLFTADAHVDLPPGDHRGIAGLDVFHGDVMSPFGATQHIITNVLTDLDGDHATFRSNTYVTHVVLPAEDAPTNQPDNLFLAGGTLSGATTRTPQGWRFHQATLDVIWRTGDFGPKPPD